MGPPKPMRPASKEQLDSMMSNRETRENKSWKSLLVVGGLVGACPFASCLGAAVVAFIAIPSVLGPTERESILTVSCGNGQSLNLVRVASTNALAGVTGVTAEGKFGSPGAMRSFTIDLGAMPHFLRWMRPLPVLRGDGVDYIHFFMPKGTFTSKNAARIERCIESHRMQVMSPLDGAGLTRRTGRSAAVDRTRVYWHASPEELDTVFRHGRRAFLLDRSGYLRESDVKGRTRGLGFGRVYANREGDVVLRCCSSFGDFSAEELPSFVDDDARTILERLGAPALACDMPNRDFAECSDPSMHPDWFVESR